jgi:hypothetical protein
MLNSSFSLWRKLVRNRVYGRALPRRRRRGRQRERVAAVERLEDRTLLSTITVTSSLDISDPTDGLITFREAITIANTTAGTDTIAFNIPGEGVQTIQPTSALPPITDPVVIDGYTQPGAAVNTNPVGSGLNSVLTIELDGTNAGGSAVDGLVVLAGNSTIRGLAINRFSGEGIQLSANGVIIEGNYVGASADGTIAFGNRIGLWVSAGDNLIGGTMPSQRNLISGNNNQGVLVIGSGAAGNTLQGNLIGTNAGGNAALGNLQAGVHIQSGAADTLIGGAAAGTGNVISANGSAGNSSGVRVLFSAAGTRIEGNYIGTDVSGNTALGNHFSGVHVGGDTTGTVIGGESAGVRNVISGNVGNGVIVSGSNITNTVVVGNLIGTNATGTAALGNTISGVALTGVSGILVGGSTTGARNVISGNVGSGVVISQPGATGNAIQGNFIGTDITGTTAMSNGFGGVRVFSDDNTIGGTGAGEGNVISGNSRHGVEIQSGSGNLIQGNFIGTDIAETIDLGNAERGVSIVSAANNNMI